MKALPILFVSLALAATAAARETVTEPFVGVTLTERYLDAPRPLSVRLLDVDPHAAGVRFAVTPREPGLPNGDETTTQTTGAFVERIGAQLGFNGSFFRLEHHSQQRATNNVSLVASEGDTYSPWEPRMPLALSLAADGTPAIVTPADGDAFFNAVAGNTLLVDGGVAVPDPARRRPGSGKQEDLHPRTAVGVTAGGHLLVMTVDGRQPGFSEGVFPDELAGLMVEAGAVRALNLDGGGSTTLVADLPGDAYGPLLVNSAVGRGAVGSQRNNGVNLAVFADATADQTAGPAAAPEESGVEVLEDFESGEGRFDGAFESGSNVGVDAAASRVDRVQDAAPGAGLGSGRGAQRLAVTAAEGASPVEVRLLSGGGEPSKNTPFEPSGRLSLFARNLGPGPVFVAPMLDDSDGIESGVPRLVPADLAWHELGWSFGDTDDWVSFHGGNGRLDAAEVTVDSLHATADGRFVLLWDRLVREAP